MNAPARRARVPRIAISKSRLWNTVALLAMFLAGTAFAFWPFVKASREMRAFCEALPLGAPLADLRTRVAAAGYELLPQGPGRALVQDPRAFVRHHCELRLEPPGRLADRRFADD
jgi:hypothetical protein